MYTRIIAQLSCIFICSFFRNIPGHNCMPVNILSLVFFFLQFSTIPSPLDHISHTFVNIGRIYVQGVIASFHVLCSYFQRGKHFILCEVAFVCHSLSLCILFFPFMSTHKYLNSSFTLLPFPLPMFCVIILKNILLQNIGKKNYEILGKCQHCPLINASLCSSPQRLQSSPCIVSRFRLTLDRYCNWIL